LAGLFIGNHLKNYNIYKLFQKTKKITNLESVKKLITYIFILLYFTSFSQELSHQIIVKGEVLYENKNPADCKIEVFEKNKKVNESYASSGSFRLVLEKGKEVILKFSEKDYVSKIMTL
jgi:hypothetical protein